MFVLRADFAFTSISLLYRKLFVGGISWDTTAEGMKAYFEKFGEVADCVVMKDSGTSRPRGFGFVKFKEPSCVNHVLAQSAHMLDNKKVSLILLHD